MCLVGLAVGGRGQKSVFSGTSGRRQRTEKCVVVGLGVGGRGQKSVFSGTSSRRQRTEKCVKWD